MASPKVFISYHHKGERAVVDKLVEAFGRDYDVFTDQSPERDRSS